MEAKGLKEVKKGAKLILKKQKIDAQLKELAKVYHSQVGFKSEDEKYFIALADDYNKQQKSR